jgi:transcriptional regulator with XRE-family HTH domain
MTPVKTIAQRVSEVRRRRGFTQDELAAALQKEGVPWARSTVAKLESNRRDNVSVIELLALAYCLGCSPTHLVVPPEGASRYQITPKKEVSVIAARRFVRGVEDLPGLDWRGFAIESPDDEYTEYVSGKKRYIMPLAAGDDDDG